MAVQISSVNNGLPIVGTAPVEFIGSGFGITQGSVGLLGADVYFAFGSITVWTDNRIVATPPAGIPDGVIYYGSVTVSAEDPPDPLGTAAFKDVVANRQDTTVGAVLITGSGGANSTVSNAGSYDQSGGDLDGFNVGGMWAVKNASVGSTPQDGYLSCVVDSGGSEGVYQRFDALVPSSDIGTVDPSTYYAETWFRWRLDQGNFSEWRVQGESRIQAGGVSHSASFQAGTDNLLCDLTLQQPTTPKTMAPDGEPEYFLTQFSYIGLTLGPDTKIYFRVRSGSTTAPRILRRGDGSPLQPGDFQTNVRYWVVKAKTGQFPEYWVLGLGGSSGGMVSSLGTVLHNTATVGGAVGHTYIVSPDSNNQPVLATTNIQGTATGQQNALQSNEGSILQEVQIIAGRAGIFQNALGASPSVSLALYENLNGGQSLIATVEVPVTAATKAELQVGNSTGTSGTNVVFNVTGLSVAIPDHISYGVMVLTDDTTDEDIFNIGQFDVGLIGVNL